MPAGEVTEDCPKCRLFVPGNKGGNPPEGGLIPRPGGKAGFGGHNRLPGGSWIGKGWGPTSPLLVTRSHRSKGLSSRIYTYHKLMSVRVSSEHITVPLR
jgi:hypothetical protein